MGDKKIEKMYSIPELEDLLGVSRSYLYRKIWAGEIRAYKTGTRLRIPESEVQKILQEAKREKKEE